MKNFTRIIEIPESRTLSVEDLHWVRILFITISLQYVNIFRGALGTWLVAMSTMLNLLQASILRSCLCIVHERKYAACTGFIYWHMSANHICFCYGFSGRMFYRFVRKRWKYNWPNHVHKGFCNCAVKKYCDSKNKL